jgi:hypothetical protein
MWAKYRLFDVKVGEITPEFTKDQGIKVTKIVTMKKLKAG